MHILYNRWRSLHYFALYIQPGLVSAPSSIQISSLNIFLTHKIKRQNRARAVRVPIPARHTTQCYQSVWNGWKAHNYRCRCVCVCACAPNLCTMSILQCHFLMSCCGLSYALCQMNILVQLNLNFFLSLSVNSEFLG